MVTEARPVADVPAVQRRTLATLAVTQVFGGVGVGAAISVNALLAKQVTGSEQLAGLAQTFQVLGAALATAVVAQVSHRGGRRRGLAVGYLLGLTGAVLSTTAGALGSFPVLLLGALLIGSITAAGGQIRYAATDLSAPAHRGRDLSLVVWATTVGSVLGPNLGGPGGWVARAVGLPVLAGPYLFTVVGVLVALAVLLVRLRPDPLLLARCRGAHTAAAAAPAHTATATALAHTATATAPAPAPEADARPARGGAGWGIVRRSPVLRAATLGLALSHAVMVSVMVMTPIHMDHGHASIEVIGLVISIHILGMYAFSPLVGMLVDRVGAATVLVAGAAVLLLSLALSGGSHAGASSRLGAGLFLLGVGWSLAQIAASTLVTAATTPATRPLVQGSVDVVQFATAAVGGALAGVVVGGPGYAALNLGAAVLTIGVLVAAGLVRRHPGARLRARPGPRR